MFSPEMATLESRLSHSNYFLSENSKAIVEKDNIVMWDVQNTFGNWSITEHRCQKSPIHICFVCLDDKQTNIVDNTFNNYA